MAVPKGKESEVDAELDSLYDIGLNFKEKLKRKDQKQQKFNNYIQEMQTNELDQSKIRDRNYKDIKRQTHDILSKARVQQNTDDPSSFVLSSDLISRQSSVVNRRQPG